MLFLENNGILYKNSKEKYGLYRVNRNTAKNVTVRYKKNFITRNQQEKVLDSGGT